MLELRPIVTDADRVVLGGNMRLKACKAAGLKTVPVVVADHLTEAQRREFIVKDNVGFGDWDWDALANEWEALELDAWGLTVPIAGVASDSDAEHWQDMPEFVQEDKTSYREIKIHFPDQKSVDAFARLLNQPITDKTKFLWYPEIVIRRYADKIYTTSDDASS
jgi:hypothetical protein